MRGSAVVASLLVLLLSARGSGDEPARPSPPAAPAQAAQGIVAGTHVLAAGDVPDEILAEAALLGDQLVPLLAAHFEAEVPKDARPLRVVIHASEEGFRKAVLAEGGDEVAIRHAHSFTPKRTLVSHLRLQDEPFDTRRLVLHELVHQVQDKTFAEFGAGTDTEWHREGLAEHFGWHVRGKYGLQVGRIDALARNPMTWDAAVDVARGHWDLWEAATGQSQADTQTALTLVHALLSTSDEALRARFRRWEREAWRRRDAHERFAASFDRVGLRDALRANWRLRKRPWEIRLGQWDEEQGRITGRAQGPGVLVAGRRAEFEINFGAGVWRRHVVTRARVLGGGTGAGGVQVALGCGHLQSVLGFGERLLRLERGPETITLRLLTSKEMVVLRTWPIPLDRREAACSLELKRADGGILATVHGDPSGQELVPLERFLTGTDTRVGLDPRAAPETPAETWARMSVWGALYVLSGQQTFEDVSLSH